MKKMYVTVIMFATFSGLIKLSKMVMYMQRMGPLKEKEKRLRMLSDQKRRVENVNILIDLHMKKFEYFRLVKLKVVSISCVTSDVHVVIEFS
jgi:hypothetical protein